MRLTVLLSTAMLAVLPAMAAAQGAKDSTASLDDRYRLTRQQIESTRLPTAFDVVDRLRRRWFRDPLSGKGVAIYQDNRRLGDRDALKEIPAQEVEELQYIEGQESLRRWGQDAEGGAIIVILKDR